MVPARLWHPECPTYPTRPWPGHHQPFPGPPREGCPARVRTVSVPGPAAEPCAVCHVDYSLPQVQQQNLDSPACSFAQPPFNSTQAQEQPDGTWCHSHPLHPRGVLSSWWVPPQRKGSSAGSPPAALPWYTQETEGQQPRPSHSQPGGSHLCTAGQRSPRGADTGRAAPQRAGRTIWGDHGGRPPRDG